MKKLAYFIVHLLYEPISGGASNVGAGEGGRGSGGGGHLSRASSTGRILTEIPKQVGAVKETEVITRSQLFRHRGGELFRRSCNILHRLSQCSVKASVISQCQKGSAR